MDDANDLAVMMARFAGMMGGSTPFDEIAQQHRQVLRGFAKLSPPQAAATFGALLTLSRLQANATRLDWLVHIALATANGREAPTPRFVRDTFEELGKGLAGRLEDPAEDAFVSLVRTSRGDFRVLDGIWEAAGFYLERIVRVVEGFPEGPGFDEQRESVFALLLLSDLMCERAGLHRYQLGSEFPARVAPVKTVADLETLRARVRFTPSDLSDLGVELQALSPFLFDPADRASLLEQRHGHTTLELQPLVIDEQGDVLLVLPTAVSLAIRRLIIGGLREDGLGEALLGALALEYARHFSSIPILGRRGRTELEFKRTERGLLSGVAAEVEPGHWLQMVFFVDTLEDFETATFDGGNPDPMALADDIDTWVDLIAAPAMERSGFRSGLTLLVGCGVGRGGAHVLNDRSRPGWTIETISAPDFSTLCWIPDFDDLALLRLIAARRELEALGTRLSNANGLLNLVAWQRSLEGHLVPHGHLPDSEASTSVNRTLMITQNGLRAVRDEVATTWDARTLMAPDGNWTPVRREGHSFFADDRAKPYYVGETEPVGVFVTKTRSWWCACETPEAGGAHANYERWKALGVWLCRAAPILEEALPTLPLGPILWRCDFEGSAEDLDPHAQRVDLEATRRALVVDIDLAIPSILVRATPAYEQANLQVENVAERALVDALVRGAGRLAGAVLDEAVISDLVERIVPDAMARQQHAFRTLEFRDHVLASLPRKPSFIGADDDAQVRLGLGWRVREPSDGPWVEGKAECGAFLNAIVRQLEDEICADLRAFDRLAMLRLILLNHEAAAVDRANWRRTVAAILSLHDNREATLETLAERDVKLNGIFQASRMLVEFALCECPLDGGLKPGRLDLTRLMAKALQVFNHGGFSDAIRWDVMEPRLKVTALGDIHANWDLIDDFLQPFGRATSQDRAETAARAYGRNVEAATVAASIHDQFDPVFLAAYEDEVGASVDEARFFVEHLEEMGLATGKALMLTRRGPFLRSIAAGGHLRSEAAEALLNYLTLKTRPSWRATPSGYDDRDRQPWRFRRRLAMLRKPILQIDDDDDPRILLTPGVAREAFVYTVSNLQRGDFPDWQLKRPMRRWQGRVADKRGATFARDVAAKLEAAGWRTEVDVKISKILGAAQERDFGDVDVLAWREDGSRLLVIECKDVQYRKTVGEISEQLADFRGEYRANGKRDYLRLHLDRIDLLRARADDVRRYLGLTATGDLESHLVFRNPVPMKYALAKMAEQVKVTLISELEAI